MKKILILFALIALATFGYAKKHRYFDGYYRPSSGPATTAPSPWSLYGNSSNSSDYGNSYGSSYGSNSYGSSSYGSNSYYNSSYGTGPVGYGGSRPVGGSSYGSYGGYSGSSYGGYGSDNYGDRYGERRQSTLEQVNSVRNNATLIQENIDLYSALAAMVLNLDEYQETIRNYTRRISNIVALIDVRAVRELVAGVSREAFDSLRTLRNTLHSELRQLNHSSDPINELNTIFDTLRFAGEEEYHHLKAYLIESLQNITIIHQDRLSQADAETIADVSMLFNQLINSLDRYNVVSSRGINDIRRVLNLQSISGRSFRTLRLENQVRLQVGILLQHLEGLDIDRLETIANNAINATFERLHQLQQRALNVSRRALESNKPGAILSEELLALREGLGQSLVDFQNNLESDIIRLIRDLARKTRLRGSYGGSIEVLVRSIYDRVKARVSAIRSTVNDVDEVIRRRERGDTDFWNR